jgi:transaldolase
MIAKADAAEKERLKMLKGRAAIANAKLAYRLFRQKFTGPRWEALAKHGARLQRPLWASTSTKNPEYRDVMYVEELIGPDTVDTMPPATIEAFNEHGVVDKTVDKKVAAAEGLLREIEAVGISMKDVTAKLLVDGIASFQKSFDELIAGLESKVGSLAPGGK